MRRVVWIDAAKGFAIILVVFGHVLGGALARGWLGSSTLPVAIYDFIYSFHMPLFFLIAGALGIKSIRTDPAYAFWSRVGSLAWPYLFWGILFIMLQPLASRFMLYPPPQIGVYKSLYRLVAGEASWFLWTLFVAHCILLLAYRVPLYLVFAFSVIIALVVPAGGSATYNLIHLFPFMVLGAIGGNRLVDIGFGTPAKAIMLSLIAYFLLALLVGYKVVQWPGLYLVAGVLGSFASVALMHALSVTQLGTVLALIGRASLVVFLLHPYFQGAARLAVSYFGGSSPGWQLTVPTLLAVIGPTIIWMMAEKLNVQWLFRLEPNKFWTREAATTSKPENSSS